ncbi:MAG: formyltransferase family protein [Proteobacteria bacterium]|nr:formyltransferase family protein [Pseudomonadota bacterium]
MTYQIGWFSTGRGQGSMNLLNAMVKAITAKEVNGKIAFVVCSRDQGEAEGSDGYIRQVQEYGIPLITFSSKKFMPDLRREGKTIPESMRQRRIAYDREVMKKLTGLKTDIIVLAGYMLVVGEEICEIHDMINLHPAAPNGPAGTWQEVIWLLIHKRAQESGNMMHLVTKELDKGPPITYCTFPIRGPEFDPLWQEMEKKLKHKMLAEIVKKEGEQNPLFAKIRQEGARREIPLVVQTVKAFAEGRIKLENKKIIAGGRPLDSPYCLNTEIEAVIRS